MSVDISVTLVTYKTDLDVLKTAIECLKVDTYSMSIVIADNASGDEYFSRLQSAFSVTDVQVVATGINGGYGYGHNFAESCSPPSKYHLIMNADVKFDPQCIKILFHFLENHKDYVLTAPRVVNPDGSLQYLNKRDPSVTDLVLRRLKPDALQDMKWIKRRLDYYEMRDIDHDREYDLRLVSGCFMFMRRDAFKAVGGFDESYFMYFEDFDLSQRLIRQGKMRYLPECQIVHFWGRGSKHNFLLFISLLRSAARYFNRWGWKLW